MEWIIFMFFLDLSYFPDNTITMYQYSNDGVNYNNTYCAELGFRAELFNKWVFIEASNYCSFNYVDAGRFFNFSPNIENYKIGIGIQAFDFLEIGYEHSCVHPVLTYLPKLGVDDLTQIFESSYDRLYVRIETKFTLGRDK
jgi:hypothetical protein